MDIVIRGRKKMTQGKRNLDGIFMRVERNGKYENVCLSDMTEIEITEAVSGMSNEWLRGAVVHLAMVIQYIGEECNLVME